MDNGIAPNAKRLLWAGFAAILAAGVGFAIRGGILDNWGREFGFTGAELGVIGGAGFTGFCFGIIIGGVIADKIGYGKLVIAAFLFHVISAFVTFGAGEGMSKASAYNYLFWGTFIFAVANGTLEAVANPLVATLFPNNRTHYLNILHASWPLGLVIGGALGWVLDDKFNMHWKTQLGLFLLPTVAYGIMFLGQHMPKSEASKQGLSLGEMLKDVGILGGLVVCALLAVFFGGVLTPILTPDNATAEAAAAAAKTATNIGYAVGGILLVVVAVITKFSIGSLLLFVLFITHAMIGAVELGTDGWIQNITGNILTSEQGKILFVFTSLVMFALRFCAHFIEKRIGLSPIGLLLICAILGFVGLNMVSTVVAFGGAMLALTIYGIAKTFFWPTMLAVASDRFPRTGAVAISIMGGIGMMSAGLIGSPGLGYAKDRFASEELEKTNPAVYAEYKVAEPKGWLFFKDVAALDGKKLGEVKAIDATKRTAEQQAVVEADIRGDRRTLRADSVVPAAMAVIYFFILLYFKSIGGYRPIHLEEEKAATGVREPVR